MIENCVGLKFKGQIIKVVIAQLCSPYIIYFCFTMAEWNNGE